MTFEQAMLVGSCALGLGQVVLASHSASLERGYRWTAGARDDPQPPLTGMAGRLARASRNFGETFPIFVAAVFLAQLAGVHDWRTLWGSGLYFGARLLFLPLYAAGVFLVRSLVWNVAVVGIVLLIWAALAP
jgi:uncharacterized MAPEG superfamily protein